MTYGPKRLSLLLGVLIRDFKERLFEYHCQSSTIEGNKMPVSTCKRILAPSLQILGMSSLHIIGELMLPLLVNLLSNDVYNVLQSCLSLQVRFWIVTLLIIIFVVPPFTIKEKGLLLPLFVVFKDKRLLLPLFKVFRIRPDPLIEPLIEQCTHSEFTRPDDPLRNDPDVLGILNMLRSCRDEILDDSLIQIAQRVHTKEQVPDVEAALRSDYTTYRSRVLHRRVEIGPQTGNLDLDNLSLQIAKAMRRARQIDENCTLQFGCFAFLKYKDGELKWWRLQEHWTPQIDEISRSPSTILDFFTGHRSQWIIRGSNLENATLEASTANEKEEITILSRKKVDNGEDVLCCAEPGLIRRSALLFWKGVYICAFTSINDTKEGLEFGLQSESKNVTKVYWTSVAEGSRPSPRTLMFTIGNLLLLRIYFSLGYIYQGMFVFIYLSYWWLATEPGPSIVVKGLRLTRMTMMIPMAYWLLLGTSECVLHGTYGDLCPRLGCYYLVLQKIMTEILTGFAVFHVLLFIIVFPRPLYWCFPAKKVPPFDNNFTVESPPAMVEYESNGTREIVGEPGDDVPSPPRIPPESYGKTSCPRFPLFDEETMNIEEKEEEDSMPSLQMCVPFEDLSNPGNATSLLPEEDESLNSNLNNDEKQKEEGEALLRTLSKSEDFFNLRTSPPAVPDNESIEQTENSGESDESVSGVAAITTAVADSVDNFSVRETPPIMVENELHGNPDSIVPPPGQIYSIHPKISSSTSTSAKQQQVLDRHRHSGSEPLDNLSNDSSFSFITAESSQELYNGLGNPDFGSIKRQDSVDSRLGSRKLDGEDSPWPEEFICPISKCLMADPVIVESGVSYERQNVLAYFQLGYTICFKTGDALEHKVLTKNSALKKAIDNWCDAHQVPRPVAPDAETADGTVDRLCGLDSTRSTTTLSTTLTELHVSSDTASSSDSSGGGSRSLGVESLKQSLAAASPEVGRTRPSSKGVRPEQIPEASPMHTSSDALSESSEWETNGDRTFDRQTHSWSGDKPRLFSDALNYAEEAASADKERYGSSSSSMWTHSSSVVNAPTVLFSSVDASQGRGGGVPLPLTTTPSAFSEQRGGSGPLPTNVGDLNEAAVSELMRKLQHRRPLEQEQAVVEVRRLTRVSAQNRVALCELEFLEVLLPLAQSRSSNVLINAVAAIMNLSLEKENKLKVARAGAIPSLIDVLKSGPFEAQEHAAGAIFSLALNDENKMAFGVLGAIPPLIHVLRSGTHGARRDAAMALYHLSFSQMNRNKLIKAGGVGILLGIAKDEKSDVVSRALLILCNIAAMQEGRVALAEISAVQVMVGLLTRGDETEDAGSVDDGEQESKVNWAEVREHAAATLLQLSHHNFRFKSQALQAGALDGLQRLAVEGTPRAREKATALLTMLRDTPNVDNSLEDNGSLYRRSYVRTRGGVADDKAESAQF